MEILVKANMCDVSRLAAGPSPAGLPFGRRMSGQLPGIQ